MYGIFFGCRSLRGVVVTSWLAFYLKVVFLFCNFHGKALEQVAVKVVGNNAEVVEPVHVFARNGTASQLLRGVWVKA